MKIYISHCPVCSKGMKRFEGGPAACSEVCQLKLAGTSKKRNFKERIKKTKKKKKHFQKKFPLTEIEKRYGIGFYTSRRWLRLRYQVLDRSDGRCELCGRGKQNGVILHVDHIKCRSKFPELQWDINNLQVLCEFCNIGKADGEPTDWRKIETEIELNNITKYT